MSIDIGKFFEPHSETPSVEKSNRSVLRFSGEIKGADNSAYRKSSNSDQHEYVDHIEKFRDSLDEMSVVVNRYRLFRQKNSCERLATDDPNRSILDEIAIKEIENLYCFFEKNKQKCVEEFLEYARQLIPDDSDLVLALKEMLRSQHLSNEDVRIIETALEVIMEQANSRHLKAGINIALKARIYGKKLSISAASIRQAYREFIEGDEAGLVHYQSWVALFGASKRGMVIQFIASALIADMDSMDPSSSRIEFSTLMAKVSHIRDIHSGDLIFIENMLSTKEVQAMGRTEADWLFFWFTIMDRPDLFKGALLDAGGKNFEIASYSTRLKILSRIKSSLRQLPGKCFFSEGDRCEIDNNLIKISDEINRKEVNLR